MSPQDFKGSELAALCVPEYSCAALVRRLRRQAKQANIADLRVVLSGLGLDLAYRYDKPSSKYPYIQTTFIGL